MQVNCEDVARSRWQADHSGGLLVQVCKDGKLRKEFTGAASFCRLRGNLLFVGRGIDPLQADCEHVVLLEACKIDVDYACSSDYGFRLSFDHEQLVLAFRAGSQEERDKWVTAMQEASVFEKLAAAEALRRDIERLTGRDPQLPDAEADDLSRGDLPADAGGLELRLSCRRLQQLAPGVYPSAQVELHVRTPPLDDWCLVGSTDVVEDCADPAFRKLLLVPESQFGQQSDFRFDLLDVRDQASRTCTRLCSLQAACVQLAEVTDLLFDADDPDNSPRLVLEVRRRAGRDQQSHKGRHMQMLWHLCNNEPQRVAAHSCQFAAGSGQTLKVREFMCDLKCSAHVPLQVARIEQQRLASVCRVGKRLGEHNCKRGQLLRLYKLQPEEQQLQLLLTTLCAEVQDCVDETSRKLFDGEYLKLSRLRDVPQLAFVPPNLQLHRLAVLDASDKLTDFHDVVSMGAPAAHHARFKKGGLLSSYRASPGLQDSFGLCDQVCDLLLEGERLLEQLATLLTALRADARSHQSLLAATDCERLAELVNQLICLASNCVVVQARVELELSSVRLQELNRKLQAVLRAAADRDESLNGLCSELAQEVEDVWQQCQLTLGRLWLSEGAKSGAETFVATLRRRMSSRSQLLTAIVCGAAAHFSRWSEAAWRQIDACGLPVYFESLLSTYKAELGMLEDALACLPLVHGMQLQFFPGGAGDLPVVEDLRRVRVCVPGRVWQRLSSGLDSLLRATWFTARPLLLNVGINEQQTLADRKRLSALATQREANRRAAAELADIVDQVLRHRLAAAGQVSDAAQFRGDADCPGAEQSLRDSLQELQLLVDDDRSKPVGVLQTAEEIVWLLDGVRVTNCKSGKDRTAMSVTLEQGRWLQRRHALAGLEATVAFLRQHGLRRKNCFRNIGTTYYAFNRVQLHTFPQQYRPPKGTYQRGPT